MTSFNAFLSNPEPKPGTITIPNGIPTPKTGNYPNQADYIVNALLVKKIEIEKGFAGVWELLNVGPFKKGNEKY